jgi:hypothetical protein
MTGGGGHAVPAMWRIGLCSNIVEFALSLLKRGIIHRMTVIAAVTLTPCRL